MSRDRPLSPCFSPCPWVRRLPSALHSTHGHSTRAALACPSFPRATSVTHVPQQNHPLCMHLTRACTAPMAVRQVQSPSFPLPHQRGAFAGNSQCTDFCSLAQRRSTEMQSLAQKHHQTQLPFSARTVPAVPCQQSFRPQRAKPTAPVTRRTGISWGQNLTRLAASPESVRHYKDQRRQPYLPRARDSRSPKPLGSGCLLLLAPFWRRTDQCFTREGKKLPAIFVSTFSAMPHVTTQKRPLVLISWTSLPQVILLLSQSGLESS